ncbi:MAG: TetR/AcrR family transcriptional regulator [Elusimicrobia bacterium]|nr:TetR/AcrR family transcriptional regulator [Elusimicrobiota bacterium]
MSPAQQRKDIRRQSILAAALECFIQYGLHKTTFEDVSKQAGVSRSLLYAYFKDKRHLFLSVVKDVLDEYRRKTDTVLKSGLGSREKFQEVLGLWGVELYAKGADSPNGGELLDEGLRAWEQVGVKYKEYLIRVLAGFAGGADAAELVVLSIKGLQSDRPSVPVLRKRIGLLAQLAWQRRGRP